MTPLYAIALAAAFWSQDSSDLLHRHDAVIRQTTAVTDAASALVDYVAACKHKR